MEFENALIDTQSLPRAEKVELQPIGRNYLKVVWYNTALFWFLTGIIAAVAIFFIDELQTNLIMALIIIGYVLLAGMSFLLYYLSFINKFYAVRDHDIIYQKGWFIRTLHVCPFNRIQHCSTNSGIFERKFGLSKLNIYTAGGDDSDISIPGLTAAHAENLRTLILQKNLAHDNA